MRICGYARYLVCLRREYVCLLCDDVGVSLQLRLLLSECCVSRRDAIIDVFFLISETLLFCDIIGYCLFLRCDFCHKVINDFLVCCNIAFLSSYKKIVLVYCVLLRGKRHVVVVDKSDVVVILCVEASFLCFVIGVCTF